MMHVIVDDGSYSLLDLLFSRVEIATMQRFLSHKRRSYDGASFYSGFVLESMPVSILVVP